ncbi:uncharacterized protein [Nicotiana tomentosiformis]|uniref:uncharacterized protein n=1 Tax=Nicotiana tomentosiformis TaxID=4098 RepID=UPI00388CCE39
MISSPAVPPPAQPTRGRGQTTRGGGQVVRGGCQPVRGHPIDVGPGGGAQHQFYVFLARPKAESSDAMITGIVLVCHRDASVLFDSGCTYSYVSSYLASYLVVPRDSMGVSVYVSTPIGDSIMVDHVYHSCVVTIGSLETSMDLLLLDMVDFDVILGIYWLSHYHAILDCHAKTATLAMPRLPHLEWKGTPVHSTSRVISYVKARRMVGKGCLAYLAYIRDHNVDVPSMDSVPFVREFPYVFPTDLPGIPPDRDIDFCIDLAPGIQPISIPPYHMALPKLKDLKEQLQDLLEQGHIRPSVSP